MNKKTSLLVSHKIMWAQGIQNPFSLLCEKLFEIRSLQSFSCTLRKQQQLMLSWVRQTENLFHQVLWLKLLNIKLSCHREVSFINNINLISCINEIISLESLGDSDNSKTNVPVSIKSLNDSAWKLVNKAWIN